ncbi:MAG TPA: hypothetical protein VIG47_13305, partial [Gemmatimonadaceae bacterium]
QSATESTTATESAASAGAERPTDARGASDMPPSRDEQQANGAYGASDAASGDTPMRPDGKRE